MKKVTKAAAKPKNLQARFDFLRDNFANRDKYFRLSFAVEFLLELLNTLVQEEKVSKQDVERFIQSTHTNKSLKEIFDHFNVKQA